MNKVSDMDKSSQNRRAAPVPENNAEAHQEERKSGFDFQLRSIGNQAVQRLYRARIIQAKLSIGQPNDLYEQEADRVADQVMRMKNTDVAQRVEAGTIQPMQIQQPGGRDDKNIVSYHSKEEHEPVHTNFDNNTMQRREDGIVQAKEAPSQIPQLSPVVESSINTLKGGGQPLDKKSRNFFEPRFGHDFSRVRIHQGVQATNASRSINARAFTLGNNIVFDSGQYQPQSSPGKRLLGHELTHVVQQKGGSDHLSADKNVENTSIYPQKIKNQSTAPLISRQSGERIQREARYTSTERSEMAAGRATGEANDTGIALEQGFQPGDIVFRLGSSALAAVIREPVTHGGIYIGNGLIHDMVGFGNRTVRLSDFFFESADPSVIRLIRFNGPNSSLIIARLLQNIGASDFRLPSDPKPWNLFSTATDYSTATCLEYSHAQFLHAINQLSADTSVAPATRSSIRGEYFSSGASAANDLISPHEVSVAGDIGVAFNIRRGLIAAADYLAEDIDPSIFENRWEGTSTISNVGSRYFPVMIQTEALQAFTYQSFVDSRRYFDDVTTPSSTTRATPNSDRIVEVHALDSDSDIRDWVGGQNTSTLADLPGAQKVIMIRRLLEGWVADEDIVAVEQLCASVRTLLEILTIRIRITPLIPDLNNIGQRIRVTTALNRSP